MINCIINAKKTIVGTTEDIYFYRRILAIMAIDIKAKLATYLLSIDGGRNIFEVFLSFLRYYQHMAFVAQCGGKNISFTTILQLQSLAQFCHGKGEVAGGDVRLGDA